MTLGLSYFVNYDETYFILTNYYKINTNLY